MESKETQANTFDIDAIKNGLDNLRYQLAHFNLSHQGINLGINAQHSGIKHMHKNIMNLASHYTSLMDTLSQVQDKIDNNRKEIQELDNQCEVLSQEREQLKNEQKEWFSEERFQEINEKLSEGNASLAKDDLEIEKRLRDFTREDLFQRMDAFNNIKERLAQTDVQFKTEWEAYKSEIRDYRQELKPYRDDIHNLNNLIISRLRHVGIHNTDLSAGDKEAIERTIKYYQLEKEFRERQEKYVDSQIVLRDLQDELSTLMTQRQALWKQNEKLEQEIDQLQPEKTGYLLHRAERNTNLQIRDEVLEDYLGADTEEYNEAEVFHEGEEYHCGGLMLHRCMKMTNIPLFMKTTQQVDPETITNIVSEDEERKMEQEQEDETREKFTGEAFQQQMTDVGPPGDDQGPDEEDEEEDEEEGEGEETFTILDASIKSLLPPAPGDQDDAEDEDGGGGGPNDASGGTNEPEQTTRQRFHSMADSTADSPSSMISKVRHRLGAGSTSSKNILESSGITAGTSPLAKQSSAKFGESTFSVTPRRSRRK